MNQTTHDRGTHGIWLTRAASWAPALLLTVLTSGVPTQVAKAGVITEENAARRNLLLACDIDASPGFTLLHRGLLEDEEKFLCSNLPWPVELDERPWRGPDCGLVIKRDLVDVMADVFKADACDERITRRLPPEGYLAVGRDISGGNAKELAFRVVGDRFPTRFHVGSAGYPTSRSLVPASGCSW